MKWKEGGSGDNEIFPPSPFPLPFSISSFPSYFLSIYAICCKNLSIRLYAFLENSPGSKEEAFTTDVSIFVAMVFPFRVMQEPSENKSYNLKTNEC